MTIEEIRSSYPVPQPISTRGEYDLISESACLLGILHDSVRRICQRTPFSAGQRVCRWRSLSPACQRDCQIERSPKKIGFLPFFFRGDKADVVCLHEWMNLLLMKRAQKEKARQDHFVRHTTRQLSNVNCNDRDKNRDKNGSTSQITHSHTRRLGDRERRGPWKGKTPQLKPHNHRCHMSKPCRRKGLPHGSTDGTPLIFSRHSFPNTHEHTYLRTKCRNCQRAAQMNATYIALAMMTPAPRWTAGRRR